MKLDDPADEIGIGLLPEGFLALAEQLIKQAGNGIGQRVRIEPPRRKWIPLRTGVHANLDIVLSTARLDENLADVVTEISLDFEHQRRRPHVRIMRLPAEKLAGKRVHASRGFA